MLKKTVSVFVILVIAGFAFGKGGPVQPDPADVSTGYTSPYLHPWSTDQVVWSMTAPLPQYQYRAANGVLGDYFYVFGEQNNPYANAYNLTTNTWVPSTPPPLGNCNWCGVPTDNALYIVGRYASGYFSEVQKFVPTAGGPTGTWTTVAPYPVAGCGIAAAWDGGDYIYAAGGNPSLTAAYRYSISGNVWTPIASLPVQRSYHGGWFAGGKFMVYGGTVSGLQNSMHIYDPGTNTWSAGANLPGDVWFATFSTTGNDMLMFSVGGGGGYGSWPATDMVQIYDPMTNTWTLETSLPAAHGLNSAGFDGLGNVISAGGYPTTYDAYKGENFPGGADPLAPAQPSGFAVSHNNLVLTATLDWVNPSLNVGGGTLTDLDGVKVYRDGDLIADVTTGIGIGTPSTYDDTTVPAAGMYNYRIVPYNDWGDGIGANAGAWIGLDVPGAPSNVVATPDPGFALEATITWTAPTEGGNGGYWPAGSWTGQRIYRNGSMVADIAGTNVQYVDNPPTNGFYEYGVSYYNGSGEGEITNGLTIFVGEPLYEPIPYDWVEINSVGTNSGITGDDQNLGPFNMGFNFPWYDGVTFNSIRICSNGWFSFTSTSTAYSNQMIPNAAEPNNLVAPYWDDFYPPDGGTIWYWADAANNRFIIEFEDINHISGTDGYYFEAIFYADGTIDYVYQHLGDPSNSGTVGVENGTGTEGYQICYNGTGEIIPANNTAMRIYPLTPPVTHDMTVTLTPYGTPIQIPANGGQFSFNIEMANNETSPVRFDVWTDVTLPNGNPYGPLISVSGLNVPGSWIGDRDRNQNVPASAPPGNYTYNAYVGIMPMSVWDSDSFPFSKLAVGDGGASFTDWNNWGEEFGDLTGDMVVATPDQYALHNAYPNPFNPTTTIVYDLKEAADVTLMVFDVNGRQVATLVDNWEQEGSHTAYFNGENLASGVYFYTIKAGDFTATKKMILMK